MAIINTLSAIFYPPRKFKPPLPSEKKIVYTLVASLVGLALTISSMAASEDDKGMIEPCDVARVC